MYRSEMCDIAIEMMKEGASHIEVMAELNIANETFYRWKKENKEFANALDIGKLYSNAWWECKGRTNLENKDFSYTGWYMNMKNRFNWSDRHDIQASGQMSFKVVTGIHRAPDGEEDQD